MVRTLFVVLWVTDITHNILNYKQNLWIDNAVIFAELLDFVCATEKVDGDSHTFTKKRVKYLLSKLNTMPKLTVLNMQMSHMKELSINKMDTRLLIELDVDNTGAQFVA
jgi:hypothetical protein